MFSEYLFLLRDWFMDMFVLLNSELLLYLFLFKRILLDAEF
ncbi:hypothetical protein PULV_a1664 [Pseudoalteromonas ulvae UL12]|nr:hypothetical protein [Pseudoalteromonas ulvae UL12]